MLDAFAAASPFGAALLEGEDPFESTIVEANPTLAAAPGYGGVGSTFGRSTGLSAGLSDAALAPAAGPSVAGAPS